LAEWAQAGIGPELLRIGLDAYDRMIGLHLAILPSTGRAGGTDSTVQALRGAADAL
jgi:hypothetical protein